MLQNIIAIISIIIITFCVWRTYYRIIPLIWFPCEQTSTRVWNILDYQIDLYWPKLL